MLERALSLQSDNLEARVNLATVLGMSGRYDRAIEEFETVVGNGHQSPGVFNGLARAYGESGDSAAAAGWLRRSLELDPDQEPVRRLLTRLTAQDHP